MQFRGNLGKFLLIRPTYATLVLLQKNSTSFWKAWNSISGGGGYRNYAKIMEGRCTELMNLLTFCPTYKPNNAVLHCVLKSKFEDCFSTHMDHYEDILKDVGRGSRHCYKQNWGQTKYLGLTVEHILNAQPSAIVCITALDLKNSENTKPNCHCLFLIDFPSQPYYSYRQRWQSAQMATKLASPSDPRSLLLAEIKFYDSALLTCIFMFWDRWLDCGYTRNSLRCSVKFDAKITPSKPDISSNSSTQNHLSLFDKLQWIMCQRICRL